MAQFVLEQQRIVIDALDLTRFTNTVGVDNGVDALDSTCFGQSTKSNKAGLYTAGLNIEGYTSFAGIDTDALYYKLGNNAICSILNSLTEGDVAYFLSGMLNSYKPWGDAQGELAKFSAQFASQDVLIRGRTLAFKTAVSATGNGSVFTLPAVGTGKKLYAALHVLTATGTSPQLTVALKSDATSAFSGAETTRIAFTAASATGVQYLSAVAPITDTNYRVTHTVSGTGASFDYLLVAGVR